MGNPKLRQVETSEIHTSTRAILRPAIPTILLIPGALNRGITLAYYARYNKKSDPFGALKALLIMTAAPWNLSGALSLGHAAFSIKYIRRNRAAPYRERNMFSIARRTSNWLGQWRLVRPLSELQSRFQCA